jgi:hypothetical protein
MVWFDSIQQSQTSSKLASAEAHNSHTPSGASTVPSTSLVSMIRFISKPIMPGTAPARSPQLGKDWPNLALATTRCDRGKAGFFGLDLCRLHASSVIA